MKLYDFVHSPNCRRVRMVLAEKQVAVEHETIDLMQGQHFSDAFKAVNPRSIIPVLETDDGTRIMETEAIMQTIEAMHPEPALYGTDPVEKGTIMMWEHRVEWEGFGAAEDLIRNSHQMMVGRALPGPDGCEQIPALAERGRERLLGFYREIDAELAGREYVAGDRFSVADITLLATIDLAAALGGLERPEELKHLGSWYARVSARPSAKV